jgi:hypothetical protein
VSDDTDKALSRADIARTLTEVERLARRKGAQFEVVAYGELADKPLKETDLVGLLVGERGEPHEADREGRCQGARRRGAQVSRRADHVDCRPGRRRAGHGTEQYRKSE